MKRYLLLIIITVALTSFPKLNFGQVPNLGTASDFVLFSTVGAVTNVGTTDPAKYLTHLTGNVGTNSGSSTGFGNVNGVMHDGDGASIKCAADLLLAYNFLSNAIPDSSIVNPVIGNDSTFKPGTYLLPGATSLDKTLTLDAKGNPNAVFIFKMPAGPPVYAFSTSPNAKVILKNGAKASNVFWFITGAVNMGTGTSMKGSIISGGAIDMSASDTLEGRALTINGAITIDNGSIGFLGYVPVTSLTGPKAPVFNASKSFTIFSSIGPVADDNFSHIVGDVGGNTAAPTNYNPLFVTGGIYGINGITAAAAADLLSVYDTLNTARPEDIILLAPTLFGHNLVLTPHTYLMNAAVTFTDTLYLDALGNPNAVFIIRTNGAFATTVNSKVALINGAQAKNVYWLVNGAVSITANSIFNGTIVTAGGAIDILSNTTLNGRALATDRAVSTHSISATLQKANTGPVNQTVCAGDTARFTVSSSGSGLTYQWRKGTVTIVNSLTIKGATTDSLTIFPTSITDTASTYNVIVMDPFLKNDTSLNVSLTVNTAPVITKQPSNQSACKGDSVRFIVTATGTNLLYQWRKGNVNLLNGAKIAGATTDTLTLYLVDNTTEALDYNAVISGTCSSKDTSKNASFIMNIAPNITIQPIPRVVCKGSSAIIILKAVGTNLIYQWKRGNVDVTNSANISGATTDTLKFTSVTVADTASNYNVVISGTCSPNDTSKNVLLGVDFAPSFSLEPSNQIICVGDSVSLSVIAQGTNLMYQWKKGKTDVNDSVGISGANTNTLTLNPVTIRDSSSNYYVVIFGLCAPEDTSKHVSLGVNVAPHITTQPTNTTVCTGDSTSLTVAAVGINLTYQWKRGNVNVVNDVTISGATTDTLTFKSVTAADTASNYYVVISGTCTPNDTSTFIKLGINIAPSITVEPSKKTVCIGSSTSLSVVAQGTNLTYQWKKGNVNVDNDVNISGATSDTLTIKAVSASDTSSVYNVVVLGVCSPSVTSNFVSITGNFAPGIIVQPTNETACQGSKVFFSVSAKGTNLTYQWRKGFITLIDGTNISGSTSDTLTIYPTNLTDTASNYSVIVNGTCLPADTSKLVSLGVNTVSAITVQPSSITVCEGSSANFTVTASGTNNTFQWRRGTISLTNETNVSGATTSSLVIISTGIADTAYNYNVVISGACSSNNDSKNVSLAVTILPVSIASSNSPVCIGKSLDLTAQAVLGATYLWTNTKGYSSTLQNPIILSASTVDAGIYSLIVSNNECNSVATNVTIMVSDCDSAVINKPGGFSPNGDGINDLFVIKGLDNYPNNNIVIFNRWGEKVFEASPYLNNWNGTATKGFRIGGNELPVGTYFYILNLGDGSKVLKETVYLNR